MRSGFGIEEKKPAFFEFFHHHVHPLRIFGKAAAHMVVDAGNAGELVKHSVQAFGHLFFVHLNRQTSGETFMLALGSIGRWAIISCPARSAAAICGRKFEA